MSAQVRLTPDIDWATLRARTGPVTISSRSLVLALRRLREVRALGIQMPTATRIPATRVAALTRVAGAAKVTGIPR